MDNLFKLIKHHLKYGDLLRCNYGTWSEKEGRFIIRPGRLNRFLVKASITFNMVQILYQVYVTVIISESWVEFGEGLGITTLYITTGFQRFEIFNVDQDPLKILNYIYRFKGSYIFNLTIFKFRC